MTVNYFWLKNNILQPYKAQGGNNKSFLNYKLKWAAVENINQLIYFSLGPAF